MTESPPSPDSPADELPRAGPDGVPVEALPGTDEAVAGSDSALVRHPGSRPSGGERVAALAEVLLCSGYPTQGVLGLLLLATGLRPYDDGGRLSLAFVCTLSLIDTALLLVLIWGLLRLHGERPIEVIGGRRRWPGEVVIALPLLLVVVLAVMAVLLSIRVWVPELHNVARNPFEDLAGDRGSAAVLAVVAVLAGGLREEVQRAFVLHRFDQYLGGGYLGLGIFSAAFGAGHAMQGWDVAIATGVMGAIWGAVYLARRSAVAPMVSHALFNGGEVFRYTFYGL